MKLELVTNDISYDFFPSEFNTKKKLLILFFFVKRKIHRLKNGLLNEYFLLKNDFFLNCDTVNDALGKTFCT